MLQSFRQFSQVWKFSQNLFTSKIHNLVFIIRSLVVAIDCVADKSKLEWKLPFFNENILFCPWFNTQNAGNRISGLWNFKIFWGSTPLDPPRKRGLTVSCWYSQILFSNLLATSFYMETPGTALITFPTDNLDFRILCALLKYSVWMFPYCLMLYFN